MIIYISAKQLKALFQMQGDEGPFPWLNDSVAYEVAPSGIYALYDFEDGYPTKRTNIKDIVGWEK